jgi:hypothetical protein
MQSELCTAPLRNQKTIYNTDAFDKCGQNMKPHVPGGDEESEDVKSGQNTSTLEEDQHSASRSGLLCVT